jgi:anti-sigma28 factor (negative regulator of flagellin synthesis)
MRINDYRLTSGGAGQSERTSETGEVSSSSTGKTQRQGSDLVEVSSFTGRLTEALQAEAQRKQMRVAELSAQFDAGALTTNTQQLSSKLVDTMLSAA